MLFFETISTDGFDQWTDYSGLDRDEACQAARSCWNHWTSFEQKRNSVSVYVYDVPTDPTLLDEDELFDLLQSVGANIVDWRAE